ncbi:ABC transporter permease [Fulvivirgaceae bacterium PWU4]|uniref:ABC transporter permease n=1 Tax=Chryseosolibacter histidini TaxID=2782349 RepID=A0AAP2DH23_9BACT|nr:ABC transporter permease [Chryseosolibacter histidini]MBT1696105.1 ABC transporter permease [Chryseosolibacter histidini]
MLKQYLTIAFRHFSRYKKYTLINTAGLSMGLALSMFILLWITDESRIDKFHHEGERIYRVFNNYTYSDGAITTGYLSQSPLAEAVLNEIPEAQQAIRVSPLFQSLFQFENVGFSESGYYADRPFFEMFTFPPVNGNLTDPLPDKNSVAISQSLSNKLFKGQNPIGKILKVDKLHDLRVTAIFADPPAHSSLKFSFVIPFEVLLDDQPGLKGWENNSLFTYIKLKPGTSLKTVNQKLNAIFKKNCSSCRNESFLFPFEDLHLYGQFKDGKASGGRIEYVRIFIFTVLFILFMACANFTNLATAQATTRWREVGVRKVAGAHKRMLIQQFLGESVFLSTVSFVFAIVVVELLMPFFNGLTNKNISLFEDTTTLMSFAGVTLFTGLLAGTYPAFYLSSVKPVHALKGMSYSSQLGGLRKSLVIFQFSLSVILIASSFTVHKQIAFVRSKNLGFEKENILTFTLSENVASSLDGFKTQVKQIPGVEAIGLANQQPFRVLRFWNDISWPGKSKDQTISFDVLTCDEGFIPALKIQLIEGRNFTPEDREDSRNFIINETAAAIMGLKDPIGASIFTGSDEGKVIGLVKDFNHTSLHRKIGPLLISHRDNNRFVFVRITGKAAESSIAQLQQLHKKHDPDSPFQYQFLGETFNREYESENVMGTLSLTFAAIAIFICCIGLFGLVSFVIERRSKEIGIRRVLGAGANTIVILLSRDFIFIILIALAIALPLAFYIANQWLQNFAYRVDANWDVFAAAGAVSAFVALVTVSAETLKAAIANPVDSLRNE